MADKLPPNQDPEAGTGVLAELLPKEGAARTVVTVMLLALVCATLVAGAAVGLRERQEANQRLDQQKNILRAAGLYDGSGDIASLFAAVETRLIRLADGELLPVTTESSGQPEASSHRNQPEASDQGVPQLAAPPDRFEFDQLKAALAPATGRALSPAEDLAGLGRLEKYALVYLVREGDKVVTVVLPIRGQGVWSTMFGYVALAADLNTVMGVTFYRHGETPGLGGEIENRQWQESWQGKEIYDAAGRPVLAAAKGPAPSGPEGRHRLDGISAATQTLKGVNNLLEFWFGDHGFKPFLERYREDGFNLNGGEGHG